MSNRTRTLKLAHSRTLMAVDEYKVILAKNTVDYRPGQMLGRDEVDGLCRNAAWEIVVVASNEGAKQ